ncbi:MAG: hypothetical protein B7Z75_12375 [Acidocella sp. 20-57-95]|nr:MAG: hypothetical protein B7Z75_12375 [Acidocella sp. 20-57-95]HQU03357.1 hypothetical protein [Acidocella sp.]
MLGHEHLQIDLSHNKGEDNVLGVDEERSIIDDLRYVVARHGLRFVADLSVPGGGRDAEALARIAQQTGLHVVCATGFYWDPVSDWVRESSLANLRDIMIREVQTGIGESGLRCGTIKVGTNHTELDAVFEKIFRAAAAASRLTGTSIITHTTKPEQATWQLDVLEDAGADLSHVLISHLHKANNFSEILAVGKRGAFIGFDQLGFKKGPTIDQVADMVVQVIAHGLGKQLILSADIARKSRLRANGGVGYETTFSECLPLLRQRHVPETQIHQIMYDNPLNVFSIRQDLIVAGDQNE